MLILFVPVLLLLLLETPTGLIQETTSGPDPVDKEISVIRVIVRSSKCIFCSATSIFIINASQKNKTPRISSNVKFMTAQDR